MLRADADGAGTQDGDTRDGIYCVHCSWRCSDRAIGREVSAKVARMEDELYATMDALTAGHAVEPALTLLRGILAAFPAGAVLDRRAGRLLP
jgi:hypothetical protein